MRWRGGWTAWMLILLVGAHVPLAAQAPPAKPTPIGERARADAAQPERIALEASGDEGRRHWRYTSRWFVLECTADELAARQSAAQLDQVFTVYSRLLPPRVEAASQLRIVLFGSLAEYRDYLHTRGLPTRHAAIYATDWNLIAAGSDLGRIGEQLQQVQREHAELRDEIATLKKELPELLRDKRDQLDRAGGSEVKKRQAFLNFKRRWDEDLADRERDLGIVDRKNEALFRQATAAMFATLCHEAFHAYLQNHVYPPNRHDLPRWFNEGLAQVFEGGHWEHGVLRVDLPPREKLQALQGVLRSNESIPLSKVLNADADKFLLLHANNGTGVSPTLYLYSWGLAYYLVFERQVLGTAALDQFVSASSASLPPQRRFEALIGQPLQEFERQWRKHMLELRAVK